MGLHLMLPWGGNIYITHRVFTLLRKHLWRSREDTLLKVRLSYRAEALIGLLYQALHSICTARRVETATAFTMTALLANLLLRTALHPRPLKIPNGAMMGFHVTRTESHLSLC